MGDRDYRPRAGLHFTTMVSKPPRVAPEADQGGEVNHFKPPKGDYIGTAA
jgi:hypothetical protein